MNLTCPECKNQVDLSRFPNLAVEHAIECNHCGIMLAVTAIDGDTVSAEIVDEGK
jgi:Zn ribbon nucleic-acid-binding protein